MPVVYLAGADMQNLVYLLQDKSCLEWLQGIGQEGAESCGTDRKYNETADDLRSADKADFRDLCCQVGRG